MIKVKDPTGNVVPGLVKNGIGLVVSAEEEFLKYKRDRETAVEINKLKDDVSEIKTLLQQLLLNSISTQGK